MATYYYYCNECRKRFEVECREGDAERQTTCPSCGNVKAMRAFSSEDLKPRREKCVPGSGC